MNNKLSAFEGKKYLFLFIFIMALNISLTVFLIRVSFGQSQKADFSSQPPVKVKILEQKDCPIQITVINVDNSALSAQNIVYSLQNISNKPIRAYTLLGNGKNDGKVVTNSFAIKLFQPSEYEYDDFFVEREIAKEGTIFLSIDYVEFEDGSSWGKDREKKSKEIAGEREGRKAAIRHLKDLIKNQNANGENGIKTFLKQDVKEISVDVPDTNQPDEWKRGFRGGYKGVISILQRIKEQEIESLAKKLDEMEKFAN
ncbi:MAG TPA: hypothetical protein VF721_21820 [Pyrinomonadaceae bacterium]